MGNLRAHPLRLALAVVVILVVAAVAVLSSGSPGPSGGERASAGSGGGDRAEAREERERGHVDPRKEAKFERTVGEAARKGPENPAAEQVDNRAFPRSYVDDRRAVKSRKAFTGKPRRLSRSAFNSTTAYSRATKA